MDDLEQKLEDSLHQYRGPFAREHELHAIHAQLAKGTREQRSFRLVEKEPGRDE